ncbi:glucose-6-phosphate dehydrogenase [Rhodococcus sp. SRB_17]|uniref:glucose-6-phosphate dehydrogenase n=1 Tax=Rhodococcus sp. OK302 TaxID=1882769 RepID=UPI000B940245|nr:glucose-6-phosphate dehydrogenase [Rhodococcus sp. OK302]NMM87210.1 glucose-6-phosphate dehydrogenase [Rhodococcus sp. SRB_17]OYD70027.1 glucose-6-phosphate 1-dehydrogenase [Rhodococcus sp. OK302]
MSDSAAAADWVNPLRDSTDKRLPHIAGPCALVIFGVTGDLARRKLMPAIYDLANRGLLPPGFALVGFARRDWTDEDFAQVVLDAVKDGARTKFRQSVWERLADGIRFVKGNFDDAEGFTNLANTLATLDTERGIGGNHGFYLAIPPDDFPQVLEQLSASGLAQAEEGQWRRVVIEKPFGHDLESARELNAVVNKVFPEDTVFRIDHYLGKETVQNILALRFANQLFDPIWNAHYVDHVQITMAEDIGLGGRAGYYDGIGAARDVIQNHLLQLLAFTAMEEPISFEPLNLQAEKIKVLSATRLAEPLDETTARGQYAGGWQGGLPVIGLLEEDGFAADSTTETFAAITLEVDTRRWAGVPFYLRTGKRLGRRVTEIAVVFKRAPHLPFDKTMTEDLGQNALVIRVQPDEGVTMRFGSKVPGSSMEVRDVNMDFSYGQAFTESSPEAYERLILDVLLGEPSLFPVNAEVELSWEILDPVLEHWAAGGKPEPYEAGTWGPPSADEMMNRTGREWRRP